MLRTHTCGELTSKHINTAVTLCGWAHRIRDIGHLAFIQLRDRYGLTQCVFDAAKQPKELHDIIKGLHKESCLAVSGKIIARSDKDKNAALATGEIELEIERIEILNNSLPLPFEVDSDEDVKEETRFKYRFIDLRRAKLRDNIITRHEVIQTVRSVFAGERFLEVHTPLFIRSTPEGARDFVVPSRILPGKFYALPQSPQLYKQMLMISGFDRYFQFAHCFRDEDLRADRGPVHTQIDLEMTFVEEDDVFEVIEKMMAAIFRDIKGTELKTPFPRMSYNDAMSKYGSDKPDLRFGLELQEISSLVQGVDFAAFKDVLAQKNGAVLALCVPGGGQFSRKQLDELTDVARKYHLKGLMSAKVTATGLETGIAKYLPADVQAKLCATLSAKDSDLLLFVADQKTRAQKGLGQVRLFIGRSQGMCDPNVFHFTWVNDFPLFEQDETTGQWMAMHHLFTMPHKRYLDTLEQDPGAVLGHLYDLVVNGVELSSGSIRIHKPELQKRIMNIVNMSDEEADGKFGFLFNALKYGAPPHGGAALGLDRLVAILCGEESIKEVIAFPHNSRGEYLLDGSPAKIDPHQLQELKLATLVSEEI